MRMHVTICIHTYIYFKCKFVCMSLYAYIHTYISNVNSYAQRKNHKNKPLKRISLIGFHAYTYAHNSADHGHDMYTYMPKHMCVYTMICIHTCQNTCACMYTRVTWNPHLRGCHACVHAYTAHMHTPASIKVTICIHTYICICIHTYICICIHTYICMPVYIHTQILLYLWPSDSDADIHIMPASKPKIWVNFAFSTVF